MQNKILSLFLCLIMVVILFSGCAGAFSNNNAQKTVSELEALMTGTQENEEDAYYEQLEQVLEKIKKFSDEDVLDVLKNDEISDTTKHVILEQLTEINNGNGIKNQALFEKLLTDETVAQSNKLAIINALDFEKIESLELLKEIVYSENSALTTNALKQIKRAKPRTALNISNDIMANYMKYGDYQIKAAVMTKSEYLRDMSVNNFEAVDDKEIDDYIDFCSERFQIAVDNSFYNAMVFSVMNIHHIKAVRTIIVDDSIDDLLRRACVVENYQTFSKVLENDVSDEDLECIIKAMEIQPIKEIGEILKQKDLSENSYSQSELEVIIEKIEKDGIPADEKSIITKQIYNWE